MQGEAREITVAGNLSGVQEAQDESYGLFGAMKVLYRSFVPHDRFLWILLNLLLLTIIFPILDNVTNRDDLLALFFAMFLFCIPYALRKDDTSAGWIYYFTLPCCLLGCALLILPDELPELGPPKYIILVRVLVHMAFFFSLAVYLFKEVWRDHAEGFDKIIGGCCLYLLAGTLWAYSYSMIEEFHPGSFATAQDAFMVGKEKCGHEHIRASVLLYFSFITLTTVGFGDVTPLTSVARTFVWLEAVFGQFLVTVLLARLVSMYLDYAKEQSTSIKNLDQKVGEIPVPSSKYHPRASHPNFEFQDDLPDRNAA
jgi:voltage-gated potassium channel